jgi:hypothetical protein
MLTRSVKSRNAPGTPGTFDRKMKKLRLSLLLGAGLIPYLAFLYSFPLYLDAIAASGTPGKEHIVMRGHSIFPVAISLGFGLGFLLLTVWVLLKGIQKYLEIKNEIQIEPAHSANSASLHGTRLTFGKSK